MIWKNTIRPPLLLCGILMAILLVPLLEKNPAWALSGADVAIFNDTDIPGGGAWSEGIIAIKAMLETYGYSHEDIAPIDVNTESNLNSLYKVIIFGGGWAGGYNTLISSFGTHNVRNFVFNGGGYFGICAGAYFASNLIIWREDETSAEAYYDYPTDLFPGIARGVILAIKSWNGSTGCSTGIQEGAAMTTINLNTALVPNLPNQMDILYYGGPSFLHWSLNEPGSIYSIIGTYNLPGSILDGTPAMILFPHGQGQVFLTGPHPEVSFENCTLFYDSTNWAFMDSILTTLMQQQ